MFGAAGTFETARARVDIAGSFPEATPEFI
jgi:hypothetical protein